MKKYLLPENGRFYKANLHSHSTVSDGKMTPEEMKEHYKKAGYSILAYTDHDVFVAHPELTDEDFLVLHGYEASVDENAPEGETVTSAEFEVRPEFKYVRLTVHDLEDKHANTNAYFTDELFE